MGKVIVGTTMSLDGFMNDRNGSVARLYPDFAAMHETEMLQEAIRATGAVVMGGTPLIWPMTQIGMQIITSFRCQSLC